MTSRPARAAGLFVALATLGAGLTACKMPGYTPGGPQASIDQYTYESTPDFPQTVIVKEWTTDETIWSLDVPVGKQLTIRFYADHDPKNTSRPDLMRWDVRDRGTEYGELKNTLPMPPSISRRVDVVIRKSGEAIARPATAVPAAEPVSR